MWKYKIKVNKCNSDKYDFIYYKSKFLRFDIMDVINYNKSLNDGNFILYEDGSLSWFNKKGYFSYYDRSELLEHIQSINIVKL